VFRRGELGRARRRARGRRRIRAIVAVPIVAAITVILDRLQDREVPVPVDPAAVEAPDEKEREAQRARPSLARR